LYALVTEIKRSSAPQLLQTLKGSCVEQIKTVFANLGADEHSVALALLVQLVLDHFPDTPQFELVACNLVEDISFSCNLDRFAKQQAVAVSEEHTSPLAPSVGHSLRNPLFEEVVLSK
jgi:hypothetical protein